MCRLVTNGTGVDRLVTSRAAEDGLATSGTAVNLLVTNVAAMDGLVTSGTIVDLLATPYSRRGHVQPYARLGGLGGNDVNHDVA